MNTTTERPAPAKHDYDRIPYLVAYQNNSAVRDVYGGIALPTAPEPAARPVTPAAASRTASMILR